MSERLAIFEQAFLPGVEIPPPAVALPSFTGASAAFAAASLARRNGGVCTLVVAPGLPEADALAADLAALAAESGVRTLEFPPPLEDDPSSVAARLRVSAALGAWALRPHPLVVVASALALETPVATAARVAEATIRLEPGAAETTFAGVQERLRAAGYERAGEVTAAGEYAVRGGVLDVWPGDGGDPVRAEFFGDELESLRVFDPATQTSVRRIAAAEIPPTALGAAGARPLVELLPAGSSFLFLDHNAYGADAFARADAARIVYAGDPAPRGVVTGEFHTAPLPGFAELGVEAARNPEILEAARNRLAVYLTAAERKGALIAESPELSGGFEVFAGTGGAARGLVVVTKGDRTFARRRAAPRAPARVASGERFTENLDLEPGELVVHVDYGVGRYCGTTEVEVGGARSEVFTIEYADGGRLHVPVTHAHLLARYVGVKGEQVKLHRLDGRRWTKEKSAAQKSVADLAANLLETQARRAVVPGCAYDLDLPGIADFEAAFPYEETPDQARAIEDVKKDLASTRPMDRLVCGDAGYGKTEVALRAAFVVAMNGRQTAVLAPTTVLAEQHYETFLARFDGTPVRVEAMSRFQTEEARKGTRARLASGATDVVVGTHALLTEKTVFHDLGLIVIDEEQRFGVKHKEFLKRLRATADVLTMSATPIPRTLYLSMTGARDLSLLRTPPRERVAVETKIVRDLDATVRAAVEAEIARGGQVYYLYNRVATISRAAARLRALVPRARVEVAHGQMPAALLARKMQSFSRGQADVLLCTTIVESGLDIPRANTIIVDRADRFGLAELYQLRGRVGRSSRQGHAYFLLPEEGLVDAEARERLEALRKHAGLGAGFNIAMRDLELRGAGNLLGREQSGHIAAVGFQLYCQLLQRTIARLKGEEVPLLVDVSINLDFLDFSPGSADAERLGACLPYDYVEDEAQRMDFHKRLAETSSLAQVRKLKGELADRYGRLPNAAARLVKLAEFRVLCAQAKIRRLDVRNGKAVFYREGAEGVAFVGSVAGSTPERKINALFRLLEDHVRGEGAA